MFCCVKGRKVKSVIHIPKWAEPHEVFAAQELSRYIRKMTGAELEIRPGLRRPGRQAVVIADLSHPATPALLPNGMSDGLRYDGFRIRTVDDRLYVVSREASGVVFGVYEYLRRFCGCSFLDYGERGEDIPCRETVSHGAIDLLDNPRCWYRSMQASLPDGEDRLQLKIDWMAKQGFSRLLVNFKHADRIREEWLIPELRKRGLKLAFAHHIFRYLLPEDAYLRERPDMYALKDGKRLRVGQLDWCMSNPDLLETVSRRVIDIIRQNPEADIVELWPDDGLAPLCECADCARLNDPLDDAETDWNAIHGARDKKGSYREDAHGGIRRKMRRYLHLANAVAERLERVYPRVKLDVLAYGDLTQPPAGDFEIHPNVLVCLALYWRCNRHHLFDPACSINRQYVDILREWLDVLPPDRFHFYSYEMGMNCWSALPYPLLTNLFAEWDVLAGMGVAGTHIQSLAGHVGVYGMNYVAVARLMREKHESLDRFIDGYCRSFFGRAAGPMADLVRLWEKCMHEGSSSRHIRPSPSLYVKRIFSREAVRASLRLCDKALSLTEDPKHRWRVERVRALTDYVELWRSMPEAHSRIMANKKVSASGRKASKEWLLRYRGLVRQHMELGDDLFAMNYADSMLRRWLERI